MDCRKKAGNTSQLDCFKLGILAEIPYQPMSGLKLRQNAETAGFNQSALFN
jgi:hypothetical protein